MQEREDRKKREAELDARRKKEEEKEALEEKMMVRFIGVIYMIISHCYVFRKKRRRSVRKKKRQGSTRNT